MFMIQLAERSREEIEQVIGNTDGTGGMPKRSKIRGSNDTDRVRGREGIPAARYRQLKSFGKIHVAKALATIYWACRKL